MSFIISSLTKRQFDNFWMRKIYKDEDDQNITELISAAGKEDPKTPTVSKLKIEFCN